MPGRNKTSSRPGFMETMRQGWKPPARRSISFGAPAAGGAQLRRPGRGRRRSASGQGVPPPGKRPGRSDLLKQREELSRQFAELQWDLGGIAYEMSSRDRFRPEVLNKQAQKLQEVDAKLGQIERVLTLGDAGAAGSCPSCGSLQARGAVYCWKCGKELKAAGTPKAESPKAEPKPAAPELKPAAPEATSPAADAKSAATDAETAAMDAKTAAQARAQGDAVPDETAKPKRRFLRREKTE